MTVIQAHAQAFLTLLAAAPGTPALTVYDAAVPAGVTPPYVVAYVMVETSPAEDSGGASDLTLTSNRLAASLYLHAMGGNAAAARAVASRARTQLVDVTPTVTGRSCWPIRHIEAQPPQRDESTGQVVMDLVDVYQFFSVPG